MAGQAFDLLRGSHFELDGHLVTFISQNQVLSLWYERTLMNFEDFLPTVDGSINRHFADIGVSVNRTIYCTSFKSPSLKLLYEHLNVTSILLSKPSCTLLK